MKTTIFAALMTLAAAGAQAQVYVGGTVGLSRLSVDCTSATNCDDLGAGYKAYVGYTNPAMPSFSLELGALDFGKGKFTRNGASAESEVKTKAVYVAGVWHTDFSSQLGGALRLGAANVRTSCDATGPGKGVELLVGGGADYAFTKHLKAVGGVDLTRSNCGNQPGVVALISLGAQYNF